MNKLTKLAVMGGAVAALALSGTAQAAATRSGAALPAASKKVIKRSTPAAAGIRSNAEGDPSSWVLGAGALGLTIVAVVIASQDGDSDG